MVRKVIVGAAGGVAEVIEGRTNDWEKPDLNGRVVHYNCVASRRGTRRGSRRHILLENTQVSLVYSRHRRQRREAVGGGSCWRCRSHTLTNRVVLVIKEEKKFVLDDGTADLPSITVAVEAGLFRCCSGGGCVCEDCFNRV